MKTKFFLIVSLLFISITAFCQDTTQMVFNQVPTIVKDIAANNTSFKVMIICAIVGFVLHTFYSTWKGVNSLKNGTPVKFILSYWIKDNAYPKLISIISIISGSAVLQNLLPTGITGLIILGVISLITGVALDWITQFLNMDPKQSLKNV